MAGTATLLLVTGPPGAGKTTLTRLLAADLGWPALHRDEIFGGMARASMDKTNAVFFAAIGLFLDGGVSHVAEAAFQHPVWARGLAPLLPAADVRIVRCQVAPAVTHRRIELRGKTPKPREFEPVRLGVPTLDVDTTDGYAPGLETLRAYARSPGTGLPS